MLARCRPFLVASFPVWLGLLACLSVAWQLDLADECAWTTAGPGLTFDENLNTGSAVYVVESILQSGLAALDPRTLQEIFNAPGYHPDYPPLGRMPLGVSNALLSRLLGLGSHPFYMITYARVGSAICFGCLIWLITAWTRKRLGWLAALGAGLTLWATPRVFGHAHLASVETAMNLAYVGCILACLKWIGDRKQLTWRDGLLPGLFLGLALLTKIQAIFLPPVISVWILWNWKRQGILPLAVIALVSAAVFFVGWPWLWSDPLSRFVAYFAQTTDRSTLYCEYLGVRYADRNVPFHYPFVMFLITTPLSWLVLGMWGMWFSSQKGIASSAVDSQPSNSGQGLSPQQNQLLLGAFWLPLFVFAIPGVPVYDGERLFLMIWPIFSIWVGVAVQRACEFLKSRGLTSSRWRLALILMLIPLVNIRTSFPALLSSYSVIVGGLRGAAALGMERNYWGDAVSSEFLREASHFLTEGETLAIAPVLHPLFPQLVANDSWLLHRPDLNIIPYDDKQSEKPRFVLHVRRDADPWKSLTDLPPGARVLQQMTRQGVVLAELIEFPKHVPESKDESLEPRKAD
ncbi:glycosyltransferase family 39 protein [Planctomicrobium sp. SH661]|uniref:glycosyltransferase family 39 protein n=1 Tax=Planctomicrobium sp. SH661 TaxID=3448124 RepID=UPI003F5BA89C